MHQRLPQFISVQREKNMNQKTVVMGRCSSCLNKPLWRLKLLNTHQSLDWFKGKTYRSLQGRPLNVSKSWISEIFPSPSPETPRYGRPSPGGIPGIKCYPQSSAMFGWDFPAKHPEWAWGTPPDYELEPPTIVIP